MGKKGEDTKKLIREKAVPLFARKGFKNVTMKDICSVTGLSRGGLYRHYDSTRQIFSEIIDMLMSAQDNELSEKMKAGFPAKQILDEILEATDEQGLSKIFDALNQLQITSLVVSHGNIAEGYPYKTVVNKLNGVSYIE